MNEFAQWLADVDAHLDDCATDRDTLPYQLHQWWDIWDHMVSPEDAANAALILLPKMNKPWPAHAAYSTK